MTSTSTAMAAPIRDQVHDALAIFLGRWLATGETYGTPAQSPDDPRGRRFRGPAATPPAGTPASSS
jgi:hypothetical protein